MMIAATLRDALVMLLEDEPKTKYKITVKYPGWSVARACLTINHSTARVDIEHAAEYGRPEDWIKALESCPTYDMPNTSWERIEHVGCPTWHELRLIIEKD